MTAWEAFERIDQDLPSLIEPRLEQAVVSRQFPKFVNLVVTILVHLSKECTFGEIEEFLLSVESLEACKLEKYSKLLSKVIKDGITSTWVKQFIKDLQDLTETDSLALLEPPAGNSLGEMVLRGGKEIYYDLGDLFLSDPLTALEAINLNLLAEIKDYEELVEEIQHYDLNNQEKFPQSLVTKIRDSLISVCTEEQEILTDSPQFIKDAIKRVTKPGIVRNFLLLTFDKAEEIKKIRDCSPLLTKLFDEVCYQAVLEHSRTRGLSKDHDLLYFVNTSARPDEPPSTRQLDQAKMRTECLSLRYRLAQYVLGFSGYLICSKSIPTFFGESPLLIRAAEALGAKVFRANASSHSVRPGPGIRFKGIDPFRFLDRDDLQAPPGIRSDFAQSVLDEFGGIIEQLKETTFTFLRSAIVIESPIITLNLTFCKKKIKIPCSLVIFNEHFRGGSKDGCLLVPSSEIPFDDFYFIDNQDYRGFSKFKGNICSVGLGYEELCRGKIPAANLLSISTIDGSFAKAFPPYSRPFMEWQRGLFAGAPDAGGHIHYYYEFSRYLGERKSNVSLYDLENLHRAVYRASDSALRLLELFEIGFSHYCQGILVGGESLPAQSYDSWYDPANQLMLNEAYMWHRQSSNDHPILAIGPTFSPGVISPDSFFLDTKTMILQTPNGDFDLSDFNDGDEPSEEVVKIWTEEVVGRYYGGNESPRFFHRDILKGK